MGGYNTTFDENEENTFKVGWISAIRQLMSDSQQAFEINPKDYNVVLELLKKIDFLQGVQETSLKGMLFALKKQSFQAGKKVLFQGEIANQLYILQSGSVSISMKKKGQRVDLAELKAPAYFGEISLLTPKSATATVTSGDEGAELLILSHDSLDQITKKVPDIRERIQKIIDARLSSSKKATEALDQE